MKNGCWMTAKDVLRVNAFKWPEKIGIKDLDKACTFNNGMKGRVDSRMSLLIWG